MLWECVGCTALYAPGLEQCPQCGEHREDDVAKISRAGGPTIAGVPELDNQSDQAEDQAEAVEGGQPDLATRIEAAARGEELATAVQDADPQAVADDEDAEAYEGWSYSEVKAECKERGLGAVGSHLELVNRLVEDDRNRLGG